MEAQKDNINLNANNEFVQPSGIGKIMREAREQMGLSVNDVANRIKFAPRQIESLEADDYVRLPEAAFVRGFVRSYARLLELDPARLIAGLPSSHMQTASAHELRSVEIPMPTQLSARRHNIIWLAAALVIAVSLAIFERLHESVPEKTAIEAVAKSAIQPLVLPDEATEKTDTQLPEQDQPVLQVPQQAAMVETLPVPIAIRPATIPVPQQAARPAPVPAIVPTPAPAPQQIVRAAPAEVTPAPARVSQQPVPPKTVRSSPAQLPWQPYSPSIAHSKPTSAVAAPVSATKPKVNAEASGSDHALRIEFDEDAWVDVKDGSDKVLVSRMHSAGSLVRVTGKAPLQVTIGNARAVRLYDNGKKINLERYTTADVARLKLK